MPYYDFDVGKFPNIDYIGLGYHNSPRAGSLFDWLFQSQDSFLKFSKSTCRYNMWLSAILNGGAIWIDAK